MERRKDHVPPAQWQDFEDLCLKLWRPRLIDAKKNGRSGQPQAGVDIFGRDPKTEAWVGIQCKQKGRWPPKVLRIRQIKKEIRKAAKFKPPLSHFIMSLPALPAPMYRIVPNAGNICRLHRRLRLSFARGTTFGCRAVTVFCRLVPGQRPFDVQKLPAVPRGGKILPAKRSKMAGAGDETANLAAAGRLPALLLLLSRSWNVLGLSNV